MTIDEFYQKIKPGHDANANALVDRLEKYKAYKPIAYMVNSNHGNSRASKGQEEV